ncbi:hypothetical protein PCS93_04515 [Escherichia coli]|nr:hypothetical protein PCS93_04515 [Escherichia coli]
MGEDYDYLGVLISVLTSWLAWTIICAELPMVAAQNGTFPKPFSKKKCEGFGLGFALYKQCVYANRRTSGLLF